MPDCFEKDLRGSYVPILAKTGGSKWIKPGLSPYKSCSKCYFCGKGQMRGGEDMTVTPPKYTYLIGGICPPQDLSYKSLKI